MSASTRSKTVTVFPVNTSERLFNSSEAGLLRCFRTNLPTMWRGLVICRPADSLHDGRWYAGAADFETKAVAGYAQGFNIDNYPAVPTQRFRVPTPGSPNITITP
jgi:hypothetical protein